jgi:hypothetical protein
MADISVRDGILANPTGSISIAFMDCWHLSCIRESHRHNSERRRRSQFPWSAKMDTDRSTTTPGSIGEEKVRWAERFVLCLFLLVFIGFGVILAGDLLSALWR